MRYLPQNYDESWAPFFQQEAPLLTEIDRDLASLVTTRRVFPPQSQIFQAFALTPLESVKVVILGQDPYHGVGEAHGLAFSVPLGVKLPPSLRNMFKEMVNDIHVTRISTDLTDWAEQGVLLLNSFLTVEEDYAGSHKDLGWDVFTDQVISYLSDQSSPILFVLWGNFAKKKRSLINEDVHSVLEGVHPSPLSAHRGFLGSKPYSAINGWLEQQSYTPIVWGDR